jgi:hypothetical protein
MSQELEVAPKNNVLVNPAAFEHCYKIAQVFADSDIIPETFRKKPANVFVALQMAERLGLDAMSALQHIYVVKGRPCLSSQMLISLANTSGLIDGSILFESNGKAPPEMTVTAKAKLKSGDVVSVSFCYRQAIELGVVNNLPWKAMPEQMCRYRAASMLVKSYFPQVALGLSAKEEMEELEALELRNITPQSEKLNTLLAPATAAPVVEQVQAVTSEPGVAKRGRPPRVVSDVVVASKVPEQKIAQETVVESVETCDNEIVPF